MGDERSSDLPSRSSVAAATSGRPTEAVQSRFTDEAWSDEPSADRASHDGRRGCCIAEAVSQPLTGRRAVRSHAADRRAVGIRRIRLSPTRWRRPLRLVGIAGAIFAPLSAGRGGRRPAASCFHVERSGTTPLSFVRASPVLVAMPRAMSSTAILLAPGNTAPPIARLVHESAVEEVVPICRGTPGGRRR
jgi:hypothetical protein